MERANGSSAAVPDPSSSSRTSILANSARRAISLRAWSSPARARRPFGVGTIDGGGQRLGNNRTNDQFHSFVRAWTGICLSGLYANKPW